MKMLLGLDEIGDAGQARVGGKAAALAALHRNGRIVPPTCCLTTRAYDLFVERAGLRAVIHHELGRKSFSDMRWEEVWDVALRIRNRFLRSPVPEEVRAELAEWLEADLVDSELAVRSSAPGEDSEGASFAGLHDSFVGVRGLEATVEAVRAVWASLWTDRALLYRKELGIDPDSSAMAVVLQELVRGQVSGVGFSVHPAEPDLAVVEAVYGLNQGLVDGSIEPDRWIFERASGSVREHAAPSQRRRMVLRDAETVIEAVPQELASAPPLDEAALAAVRAEMAACEALFGSPQDMEWTLADDRVVVLQSRPVTTSSADEGDKRAWYLSLTRSLDNLRGLRERVADELLPAMDREAEELAGTEPGSLDAHSLAEEIERRRAAYDRWVDVYWRDFIPMAHGIRLFGQFYNEVVRPEDPYEFMGLLAATPMLSVRRNDELARLAEAVRKDHGLRRRLEAGESGDADFERELQAFEREFGAAVFADQSCFADRSLLVRLLLAMAGAPAVAHAVESAAADDLARAFFDAVHEERRPLAREIYEIGRASYQLRDDDNIYLARLEQLVLDAAEDGRRRLGTDAGREVELDEVVRALRHPNLVVEPKKTAEEPAVEPGFRARARQLVGQPAGPGVATGPARVVESVDDLFEFQPGEVLVCDAVDPNMTFVVPLASAVVERRGGMLIHGAIIAREYGLPCVTGVPDLTAAVTTGDSLVVDGYLGIVTLP